MIAMELFSDDFLGDLLIMIIGLAVLGIGAQVFITGAYLSTVNVVMTIILMVVGLILIGFGGRIILDLLERLKKKRTQTT